MFRTRRQAPSPATMPDALYVDERLGHAQVMTRIWQGIACVGWLLGFVAVIGIVIVALQAADRLHIVEVYPGAQVVYRGTAATTEIKDIWVETQIRQWIYWVRRRTDDPVHDQEMREWAMRMTTGTATKKLESYYKRLVHVEQTDLKHNPMRVMVHVRADDKPNSLWRDNALQYRISWQEEWTPTIGTQSHVIQLEGVFMVEHRLQPSGLLGQLKIDVKMMTVSPLGVFVSFFDWDESATPMMSPIAQP